MGTKNSNRTPEMDRAQMRIARSVRRGNHADADEARKELRTALLRRDIQAALEAAPPLTEAQRAELAALLVPVPQMLRHDSGDGASHVATGA